ncbi:uncharacterized protein LOC114330902 [Diabrotica virgifera virgifera]|uniref:Uncharacterized protein LOC114330902 n=1 Tax=Diabrotica virgifera virgifera TaxID=50390 RepID=A0A6P7FT60_DIAVI|nr:uncharacterized protein LOC114330902 [Diabrotica virgifera virgifera]
MISGTVPLALCTVVFRRMFDTATGRIPPLPVSSAVSLPAMCMYSGAVSTILLCLYKHLKRGTLVNVGCSRQKCCSSTKNITHRTKSSRSWFLKNLWGKRKNCTDAIRSVAKQFSTSVTNLKPCLLLPKENFQVIFPNESSTRGTTTRDSRESSCEIICDRREYETRFSIKKLDDLNDSKKSLFEGCGDNKNVHKRKKSRRFSVVKRLVRDANDSKIILGERKTRSGKIYNCVK